MHTYKPAEHEETTSVAPLMQFFELVHIGDTIQSMAQVYFDKEMVCCLYITGSELVCKTLHRHRTLIGQTF